MTELPREALPAFLPIALVRPRSIAWSAAMPFAPGEIPPWRRQWLIWRAARNPGARSRGRERSECKPVAQITPVGNDAADQRAFVLGLDQRSDEVELVHGHEFENLAAHLALRIARQCVDDLKILRRRAAEKIAQFAVAGAALDEGIEAGAGAAVGESDDGYVAHLRMRPAAALRSPVPRG